jgi:AraC family transcriptional regulator of adaptative response / DNA-3-methyladenine glycosylase II
LARALADGSVELGPGADPAAARVALLDLPGIGPWTVEYVAMRALGDPDAFPVTDLGVRRSLQRLGLPARPSEVPARARAWRPWRAYATAHLWAALADGLPGATADPATRAAA